MISILLLAYNILYVGLYIYFDLFVFFTVFNELNLSTPLIDKTVYFVL